MTDVNQQDNYMTLGMMSLLYKISLKFFHNIKHYKKYVMYSYYDSDEYKDIIINFDHLNKTQNFIVIRINKKDILSDNIEKCKIFYYGPKYSYWTHDININNIIVYVSEDNFYPPKSKYPYVNYNDIDVYKNFESYTYVNDNINFNYVENHKRIIDIITSDEEIKPVINENIGSSIILENKETQNEENKETQNEENKDNIEDMIKRVISIINNKPTQKKKVLFYYEE